MPNFTGFVKDQYKHLPLVPTSQDCKDGTYIITGANQGLGFECAKHFVQLSAKKVILAVRSLSKGETAKDSLEKETGRKGVIEVWHLDLDSYASVKEFAAKAQTLERIDAVIENASIAPGKWRVSEGLETSLTSNVVSNMLLAVVILPKLEESAKKFGISPHLVVVGSEVAFQAKGELERVNGDIFEGLGPDTMGKRYQVSKLLQLYAVRQLASLRPSSETGVTINYVNPGLCKTKLSRDAPLVIWLIIAAMQLLFARTAEMGSRNLVYATVAGKESHGKYLSSCEIKESDVETWATDDAGRKMQTRVWNDLSKRLNIIQAGCV